MSAQTGGELRVWQVARPGEKLEFGMDYRYAALDPKGERVIYASSESVGVRDLGVGKELFSVKEFARQVVFTEGGARVAAVTRDGKARFWDALSGRQVAVLPEFEQGSAVAISMDGSRILRRDGGGHLSVWDAASRSSVPIVTPAENNRAEQCLSASD